MSNVNTLLTKRLKKDEKSSKMAEMAKQSAAGNLSTFSGLFTLSDLNDNEKVFLEAILHEYSTGKENVTEDLKSLTLLTSEVKAINHQAALLHGERIKRAQEILVKYREGAFSSWLMATYGNRQTPYNFLQYYEFYMGMPKPLRPQIEAMPRQAVYTLASRAGPLEKKQQIVAKYNGESKAAVLTLIREEFPLSELDNRKENIGDSTIRTLTRLAAHVERRRCTLTKSQKRAIFDLLESLYDVVERCKTR